MARGEHRPAWCRARMGTPEQIRWAVVTPNFFRLMGAGLALGRDLPRPTGSRNRRAAAGRAASPHARRPAAHGILSYEYWKRRFGGNAPIVLGRATARRTARLGPQIVGVLAPGFELLFPPESEHGAAARRLVRRAHGLRLTPTATTCAARDRPAEGRRVAASRRSQPSTGYRRRCARTPSSWERPDLHPPGADAPARGGGGAPGACWR